MPTPSRGRFASTPHNHPPRNLLNNLRCHRSRHSRNILPRVVLHNIRANNGPFNSMQMSDRLPYRHPARLAMRNPRRERRIDPIQVERNINRPVNLEPVVRRKSSHLHHVDAESSCLFALMPIHRPNPYLHQPLRQAFFHDARKRTRMRHPAAFVFVIQIGMRVKMNDRQLGIAPRKRFQDRISNRVVPTHRYWMLTPVQQFADRALNLRKIIASFFPRIAQPQIARVRECPNRAQVYSQLRPLVGSITAQSLANLRRCTSRSAQIRRVHIEWDSKQSWHVRGARPGAVQAVYMVSLLHQTYGTHCSQVGKLWKFLNQNFTFLLRSRNKLIDSNTLILEYVLRCGFVFIGNSSPRHLPVTAHPLPWPL